MEKIYSNYNFSTLEAYIGKILHYDDHSLPVLHGIRNELNKFFVKSKCRDVLYTLNTDKLFFGMRVYPMFNSKDSVDFLIGDRRTIFESYYVEFDSKLFDQMLGLTEKEILAIVLHEIGHIVYDVETLDEVKKQVDMYLAKTDDYIDINAPRSYRELLAYALKDSVIKIGSIFSKIGNEELIADSFVFSCGYGPDLESAIKKISRSSTYLNKSVDDRLLTLSWVIRLRSEFNLRRLPAIKTLNKAKQLSASELEKKELAYAANILNKMNEPVNENIIKDIKLKLSKQYNKFKIRGLRGIRDDVYELNIRLRTAQTPEDLLYVVHNANTNISILQDALTDRDLIESDIKDINSALQELYDIRQRAAKIQKVKFRSSNMLQVIYPEDYD